jgi:class 3 adenylate cyclase
VARDGTIDKLLDEQVIAFFGTPWNDVEHERRAIDAVAEVIRGMSSFWGEAATVGAAIGTGRAFVGNVGERETRDYTAVGSVVTATKRAREHAGPGEILLLPGTYAAVATAYPDALVRTIPPTEHDDPLSVRIISVAAPASAASAPSTASGRRVLTTVLVLDLVGSTPIAARIGDVAWRDLLARHYAAVRGELEVFQGTEVDTAGDGLLATFTVPAQAIRFGRKVQVMDRGLGLAARIGIHTGEVEQEEHAIRGIAVVVAARIAGLADADEIFVSGTVRDLAAGSGIGFTDQGMRSLKGVPDLRQVCAVATVDD